MKKKRLFIDVKIVNQPKNKDSAILYFTDYQGEGLMVALQWSNPITRDISLLHKEELLKWFNEKGFKKWTKMMKNEISEEING